MVHALAVAHLLQEPGHMEGDYTEDTSVPSPGTGIRLPELPYSPVSQKAPPEGKESKVQGRPDSSGAGTMQPLS